jgi:transposase
LNRSVTYIDYPAFAGRGTRPPALREGYAWLFNFRRLVVRYERRIETFRAFFYLACALIALRQF